LPRSPEKAGGFIETAIDLQEVFYSADIPALNVRSPPSQRPKNVSVYTRHISDCSKKDDPHWKRCECVKYIYLLRDGKNKTISAKTRSWTKAEEQAREIRDSWDPVKQKLRELEELQQAQEVGRSQSTLPPP
jgi:hypothetical protein